MTDGQTQASSPPASRHRRRSEVASGGGVRRCSDDFGKPSRRPARRGSDRTDAESGSGQRIKAGFWRSVKPTPGELDLEERRLKNAALSSRPSEERSHDDRNTGHVTSSTTNGGPVPGAGNADRRLRSPTYLRGHWTEKGCSSQHGQRSGHRGRVPYDVSESDAYVLSDKLCESDYPLATSCTSMTSTNVRLGRKPMPTRHNADRSARNRRRDETRSAEQTADADNVKVDGGQQRVAIRRLLTSLSRSRSRYAGGGAAANPECCRPVNVLQPASRSLTLYNMSLYPELNKGATCRTSAAYRGFGYSDSDWRSQLNVITWLRLLNADLGEYLSRKLPAEGASWLHCPPMLNDRVLMTSSGPVTFSGSRSYIKAKGLELERKRPPTYARQNPKDTVPFPAIADKYKTGYYKVNLTPTARPGREDSFCRAPQNTPAPSLCSDDDVDDENDDDDNDGDDADDEGNNDVVSDIKE